MDGMGSRYGVRTFEFHGYDGGDMVVTWWLSLGSKCGALRKKCGALDDDDDDRVETDDDHDDEEEEDDISTYIEETNTERTDSDEEHQGKGDADMNIKQEVEKEMSEEKPEGDAQATEAQLNDDNKDKFEFLQPTFSRSLSSGFSNQFLLNSPNAFLLGTITEPTEGNITSMMDVHIQQDVPNRFYEMEQFVKQLKETDFISLIHDSITSQVPFIVDKYLGSSLPNAFRKELQANDTALKKELFELNYKEVIEESVKTHMVKEVKNFLPWFLLKAVSDFATSIIEESVKAHVVNEDIIEESVSANDTIKEIVFKMRSDDVDQTFKKKADASEQPFPDANTEQPSPDVAANLKRQKNDWYKKSLILEPHDPD
uniref:Uncharacterized protein n=1 Tax=Tanacetum cinerariifolium TaxID=118510 RepID=A0A6L2K9B9_TANCI|nr:hypothetical protein [Tanacetum cinerariifolium]